MRARTWALRKGHDGPELVDPFRKPLSSFGTLSSLLLVRHHAALFPRLASTWPPIVVTITAVRYSNVISCICHRTHPSYCQSRVVVVTRYFLNGKLLSGRSFQLLGESLAGSAISRPRSIYRPNQTRFQPAVRAGVSLSQQTLSTCTVGLLCTAPRGQSTAAKGCCTARHHRLIARLAAHQIDYRFGCLRPPPPLNVWSLYTRGYVSQAYY